MKDKTNIQDYEFKLRPFKELDYSGIATLGNILFPDHPSSENNLKYNDKIREKKIRFLRLIWEKNNQIKTVASFSNLSYIYHPQVFDIDIRVHPDFQHKGYGKYAYNYIIKKLKKFDPIKLFSYAYEPHKRAIRFLKDRGFKIANREKQSTLDLVKYNPIDFTSTINRAIKNNIRIINLMEFRFEEPNADLKIWEFDSLVSPDMPFSEPIEVPKFEVYCKQTLEHPNFNPESWFIALDGEKIVGISNLWKRKENAGINTGFSGVHRDYRCMGIASSLKHTALIWAKQKNYPWIRTENDSTNKGMLGINIKAGFKPMPSWLFMSKVVKKL